MRVARINESIRPPRGTSGSPRPLKLTFQASGRITRSSEVHLHPITFQNQQNPEDEAAQRLLQRCATDAKMLTAAFRELQARAACPGWNGAQNNAAKRIRRQNTSHLPCHTQRCPSAPTLGAVRLGSGFWVWSGVASLY